MFVETRILWWWWSLLRKFFKWIGEEELKNSKLQSSAAALTLSLWKVITFSVLKHCTYCSDVGILKARVEYGHATLLCVLTFPIMYVDSLIQVYNVLIFIRNMHTKSERLPFSSRASVAPKLFRCCFVKMMTVIIIVWKSIIICIPSSSLFSF